MAVMPQLSSMALKASLPSDKATLDRWITAPTGLTAVTNGRLVSTARLGGTTGAHWHEA